MKKTIALLAVTLLAGNASAGEDKTEADIQFDYCLEIGKLANLYMQARQASYPMSKMLENHGDTSLQREIIIESYKKPKWPTSHHKQVSSEFEGEIFIKCIEKNFQ